MLVHIVCEYCGDMSPKYYSPKLNSKLSMLENVANGVANGR